MEDKISSQISWMGRKSVELNFSSSQADPNIRELFRDPHISLGLGQNSAADTALSTFEPQCKCNAPITTHQNT